MLRPRTVLPLSLCAAVLACGDSENALRRVERGEARVTGRGVLVLAIDGLRYDRTSLGRSDRETTPFLRELAAEGAELSDLWSTMPERFDAHVSLLTGSDPLVARRPALPGADRLDDPREWEMGRPLVVPRAAPSIAVDFLAHGWTTAAFADHEDLARIRGVDRGFRDFYEVGGRGADDARPGVGVFGVGRRFIDWLNARDLDEDWFAYVHMGDLERVFGYNALPVPRSWRPDPRPPQRLPVAHREPALGTLPRSRFPGDAADVRDLELQYDAALLAVDAALARIVRHVDEFGRKPLVTVVIVGTYGIPFGESGLYLTPGLPDAPDLRVPCVIRPATGLGVLAGTHVDAIVSLVDIMPTLLELSGIAVDDDLHGFSRAAELRDPSAPSPRAAVFARTLLGRGAALVTEDEHWAVLTPASSADSFAESWTGHRAVDTDFVVRALRARQGARDAGSLGLQRAILQDLGRWSEIAVAWRGWDAAAVAARDLLHFGPASGASSRPAPVREEAAGLARALRALQARQP